MATSVSLYSKDGYRILGLKLMGHINLVLCDFKDIILNRILRILKRIFNSKVLAFLNECSASQMPSCRNAVTLHGEAGSLITVFSRPLGV